jgi:glucose/arabinose dehydrogenase
VSRSNQDGRARRRLIAGVLAVGVAISTVSCGAATAAGTPTRAVSPDALAGGLGPAPDPASALPARTVAAAAPNAFTPSAVALDLSLVATGFSKPVLVTHAGDGSGRLFVVEQTGRIRIIDRGTIRATPFLDLHTAISTAGGEQGLLGLAFHPLFPTRPYVYVYFTDRTNAIAITRFTVGADRNVAIRSSGIRLLTIGKPYVNHNGGHLAFGPDGYLYIGTGDGGGAGDPGNRAQSVSTLLGKMLRIDVDHASGTRRYRSPASNPYVGRTGLDEIWSRGLRNPWRWSFDRQTGQHRIADDGQGRWEEVNRSRPRSGVPAGRAVNFGWSTLEGRACYKPAAGCSTTGRQPPQTVYAHAVSGADNCSVTGGYVYRGSAFPVLVGGYVFGDFCSGRIWVMSPLASAPVTATLVRDATDDPNLSISSFGEDEAGELYVCDLAGSVYRLTATAKP